MSPALYYLTGMMGLRLAEAGLRGLPSPLMTSVANLVSVGVTCYGRYHLDNFDSQTVNRGLTRD